MLNTILFESHSGFRWIVILVTLAALVKLGIDLAQGDGPDQLSKRIFTGFVVVLTIQWMLGIVYFIYYLTTITFVRQHAEHLLIMTVVVGLVHMARARWSESVRRLFFTTLGSAVLIFIGVITLSGGINRWLP